MKELPKSSSSTLASGGSPLAISTAVTPRDQISACKRVCNNYYEPGELFVSDSIGVPFDHPQLVAQLQGPSGEQSWAL